MPACALVLCFTWEPALTFHDSATTVKQLLLPLIQVWELISIVRRLTFQLEALQTEVHRMARAAATPPSSRPRSSNHTLRFRQGLTPRRTLLAVSHPVAPPPRPSPDRLCSRRGPGPPPQSQVFSPPPLCPSAHPSCRSLSPCSPTPHVPCVRFFSPPHDNCLGGLLLHPLHLSEVSRQTLSPSSAAPLPMS